MTASPPSWPPVPAGTPLAVLVSGGLDSAILLAEAATAYPTVYPIFVRVGSLWEDAEAAHLTRFLQTIRSPRLKPLVEMQQPVTDLYGSHWSLTGENVPDADSPDEEVFLPGRNVLLLAKPLIWCRLHGIPELATAPLAGNPFPDATPAFYDGFAECVGRAMSGSVRVLRPYASLGLKKEDVLRRGRSFPLQHTFSCIRPANGIHCGACNKCAERRRGFEKAGMIDPTVYATR